MIGVNVTSSTPKPSRDPLVPAVLCTQRTQTFDPAATPEGIKKSLEIMSRYTSLPEHSKKAMEIMDSNQQFFEDNFAVFIKDLVDFVENTYHVKIKKPDILKYQAFLMDIYIL